MNSTKKPKSLSKQFQLLEEKTKIKTQQEVQSSKKIKQYPSSEPEIDITPKKKRKTEPIEPLEFKKTSVEPKAEPITNVEASPSVDMLIERISDLESRLSKLEKLSQKESNLNILYELDISLDKMLNMPASNRTVDGIVKLLQQNLSEFDECDDYHNSYGILTYVCDWIIVNYRVICSNTDNRKLMDCQVEEVNQRWMSFLTNFKRRPRELDILDRINEWRNFLQKFELNPKSFTRSVSELNIPWLMVS